MPDDQVVTPGAPAASPPPPDAPAVSSAAPLEASAPSTSESAPPPSSQSESPKPWNQPPEERWNEILQERDAARHAYQELVGRVSQPAAPVLPATPEPDPWEGLVNHPDPQTAQFWQQQYKLQQPILQKVQGLERVVETGTQELATLRVENFRLKNPDIAPNSPEEQAVSAYVRAGYPLEAARKLGLFDLHYGQLRHENDTLKGRAGTTPQKLAANATDASSGMPPTTGLPRPPMDWREKVRQAHRKGGSLQELVNAAGVQVPT